MKELRPAQVRARVALLAALALAAIVAALLFHPIPQDPAYHAFADRRALLGLPHFWNVISNLPFLPAGALGLIAWRRATWREGTDRWPWLIVALGGVLVGLGSGWYHLHPDNASLLWDRLPMTLVFMALFAAAIAERIHHRAGWVLLGPFLALGLLSVLLWHRGEAMGHGDLRFYVIVQFYPMLALPLILKLFPARYDREGDFWVLGWLYVLAKLFEAFDPRIFALTGGLMGGHALKHLAAAMGLGWALWGIGKRRPVLAIE
jgi:hypothetical protein